MCEVCRGFVSGAHQWQHLLQGIESSDPDIHMFVEIDKDVEEDMKLKAEVVESDSEDRCTVSLSKSMQEECYVGINHLAPGTDCKLYFN